MAAKQQRNRLTITMSLTMMSSLMSRTLASMNEITEAVLTVGSRPWTLCRLMSTVMSHGRKERGLGASLKRFSSKPTPVQPDEEEQELSTGLDRDSSKSVYMSSSPK